MRLLVLALALATVAAPPARACGCAGKLPAFEAYRAAGAVFVGKVVRLDDGWRTVTMESPDGVPSSAGTFNGAALEVWPYPSGRTVSTVSADGDGGGTRVTIAATFNPR